MKYGNNLPAKPGKSEVLKNIVEDGTGRIPKKGGYYEPAPGKFEPDAYRVQEDANEELISTKIVHVEQTKDYALAITEASNSRGQKVQAVVNHDFNTIMLKKVMELFKKVHAGQSVSIGLKGHRKRIEVFNDNNNPFIMGPDGEMIPNLTGMGMVKVLDDMLRFKDFSLRDATTKSMRVAQLKILNREWREDEEIKAEKEEVKNVNKGQEPGKTDQKRVDKIENNKKKAENKQKEKKKEEDQEQEEQQGDNKDEQEPEEEKKEEQTTETETSEAKERAEERKEQIKNQPINENENKGIQTEIMDNTDELTKAEVKEMEVEEIGRYIIKKMEAEGKELTPANFGNYIMPMKRKRWILAKKYSALREWFFDTQM
jgi:hypothetical protein